MIEASAMRDAQWWTAPEYEKHDQLTGVVRYIRQNQAGRKVEDLLHASMYGGTQMAGFGFGAAVQRPLSATSRLSLNVCRNMVSAVVSKIAAKNKPKLTFLTDSGDWELKQKAEALEKFVGGVFYECGVYSMLTKVFRDACVYGTGVLKIWAGEDRVEVDRVIPWELVVDDGECVYGEPRNIYQRKYVDRLVLLSKWAKGEREDVIRAALTHRSAVDPDDMEFAHQTTADQVLVTEGWHLGESEGEPGRHVICCDGVTLLDEEWDGPFPFAFIRWNEPIVGFFGVGLVYELMGIQKEINKLLQQIQRGHHLISGHWMVENGSKVNTAQLNNDLAAIIKFSGTPPSYHAPAIIAPEVYSHLWQLYAKAFEITGISQLNAMGMKPAGLDSGEALRTYQDIQTERFLEVGQNYEEFVVEVGRQVVRCASKIGSKYRVRAVDKAGISFVDWSDVDLDEDLYVIKVFPTSLIPSTPPGKQAWVADMIKLGQMPVEDVLDIVDYPDTKAWSAGKLAPRKVVQRNIAHMLKTGEYVSPEPFDNHQLALSLVNEAYHQARLDKAPEDRLELLRQYMADTQDFLAPPAPPPPPGPPVPPGPPGPPIPPGPMPLPPEGPNGPPMPTQDLNQAAE